MQKTLKKQNIQISIDNKAHGLWLLARLYAKRNRHIMIAPIKGNVYLASSYCRRCNRVAYVEANGIGGSAMHEKCITASIFNRIQSIFSR